MTADGLASRAELVLDPRLVEIWQLVWSAVDGEPGEGSVPEEVLAGLLRLAYLLGFADAKDEAVDGSLYRELGIRAVRTTRPEPSPAARRRRRNSGR